MQRIKRKFLKYKKIFSITVLVVFLVLFVSVFVKSVAPVYKFFRQNSISFGLVADLLIQKTPDLKSYDGRTNFALFGISGGSHEGADLTDTIIFASIDFEKKDLVTVSVPRDIWLPSLKTKINSAYHYGEQKKEGGGFILAKSSISEILGIPVQYAYVLDFAKFKELIDLVGGIDVDIEVGFEDKKFPIEGKEDDFCAGDPEFLCRYEHVIFQKGIQHMDGETALKYVRSRFSGDGEGTDFSRNRRQQQVIRAFAQKAIDIIKTGKLSIAQELINRFFSSKSTDMDFSESIKLGKYLWFNQDIKTRSLVLDAGDDINGKEGFLVNPPTWQYDGLWVLVPRDEDFSEIHEYIKCNLEKTDCDLKP